MRKTLKNIVELDDLQKEFAESFGRNNITNLIFNRVNAYEQSIGKKIYSLKKQEACDFLASLNSISESTLRAYASILNKYMQYARKKNCPGAEQGEWNELTVDDIKPLVKSGSIDIKFISEDKIEEIIDELINPCDKFLIRAFYEGFGGPMYEDIWDVTLADFDEENLTVNLPTRRTIKVSRELMELAKESYASDTYESYKNGKLTTLSFSETCNKVFKYRENVSNPDNPTSAKLRVTQRMITIKNTLGIPEITIPRLANSGIIASIIKIAEEENISKMDVLSHPRLAEVRNQYNITTMVYQLRDRYASFLN